MNKQSLRTSNPYLKDPARRKAGLLNFVVSSSAIEGIHGALAPKAPAAVRKTKAAARKSAMTGK